MRCDYCSREVKKPYVKINKEIYHQGCVIKGLMEKDKNRQKFSALENASREVLEDDEFRKIFK